MQPRPGQTICDPAAGTGGFLVAAHNYISQNYRLDKNGRHHLSRDEALEDTANLPEPDVITAEWVCFANRFING